MQTIAERASLSPKTVQSAKRSLRKMGLLDWDLRGRKHAYWFPLDRDRPV